MRRLDSRNAIDFLRCEPKLMPADNLSNAANCWPASTTRENGNIVSGAEALPRQCGAPSLPCAPLGLLGAQPVRAGAARKILSPVYLKIRPKLQALSVRRRPGDGREGLAW